MVTITRPAIEIIQGSLKLYLTYVTPSDLSVPNFYTVDKLDVDEKQGFQRMLDEKRAKDLAQDLAEAFPLGYANLPTTVFLATDKTVQFDSKTNQISFETEVVCPLSVVDGQHRLEGLKQAYENMKEFGDFPLPATLAVSLDDTHQMYHFFVVNTNQKPVEPSLAQQITARFTAMSGVEELPYLPSKLKKATQQGVEELAVGLVQHLHKEANSPLKGRIRMANEKKTSQHRVAQASFVNTLKRHVFHDSNSMYGMERVNGHDKMYHIMLNYFCAVDDILAGPAYRSQTRLYNDNGVYFLAAISKWVFQSIYNTPGADFTVSSISQVLRDSLDNLDANSIGLSDKDWWLQSEPPLNRQSANSFANAFLSGLQVAQQRNQAQKNV